MSKSEISDKQRIRNKVSNSISSKISFLAKDDNRKVKDTFIEKYILCEIGIRSILDYYNENNKPERKVKTTQIIISTVKNVFHFFQFNISDEMIDILLKSKQPRGKRSARDLRNGIVHDLNINDLKEVIKRKKDLFTLMDSFILALMELH